MGTPHSKPAEQSTSSHVPPGLMEGTSGSASNDGIIPVADDVDKIYPRTPGVHITPSERMIHETDGDSTYDTPGPMEGTNVDDSNEGVIPIADDVHKIYPSSPGVHITPSEWMILEQGDCERTYVHQPSHLISDSLPTLSNLTKELASMQRDSWEERPQNVGSHPLSDITDADQPSSMDLDEKGELRKARRRAAYRKKKEEATVKQQNENLTALECFMGRHCDDIIYTPSIPQYNVNIKSHADMQNVPLLPLGDITNVCQPTSVDLDEKKELINARRRAAYRKKKEEAASKQQDENLPDLTKSEQVKARRRAAYRKKKEEAASKQLDENLPALTISANPTRSSNTSLSHDDAVLPPSTTLTSGIIHDKELARRQRDKERKGDYI